MCNPGTGKPIFKTVEERLSDLLLQELGVDLPPSAVRIFVRAHWDLLASDPTGRLRSRRTTMVSNKYSLDNQYSDAVKAEMPPPQPPMSMLASSVDGLKELSIRVGKLADFLAGSEPESASKPTVGSIGGGVFDEVERYAMEINELVGTMARHLSRIERRL